MKTDRELFTEAANKVSAALGALSFVDLGGVTEYADVCAAFGAMVGLYGKLELALKAKSRAREECQ